jgi:3-phenylpropionate/trans-cinnamate dioxygenase ferredoxin subunit
MEHIDNPFQGKGIRAEGISFSAMEENKITEVVIAGKRIALLKKTEKIYAFTAACPHAGASLCNGWVDPLGRIVCPEHKYRFDPANGRNTSGEGYKLFTYSAQVVGDDIFIIP